MMQRKFYPVLFFLILQIAADNVLSLKLRTLSIKKTSLLKVGFKDIESLSHRENIIIEVIAKRPVQSQLSSNGDLKVIASSTYESDGVYDNVYKEYKEEKLEKIIDSQAGQIVSFLFNPSVLLLMLWFSGNWVSWTQKTWVQKILAMFGKGKLAPKEDGTKPVVTELPFQIFECEVCKMEMRPARGRAEVIFGKERFRCSRCGSKAAAYFDIDNMDDPRAVARLERIKKEQEAKDNYEDLDEENEDEEEDEEEE